MPKTTLLAILLCLAASAAGATTLDISYSAERDSGIPGIPPLLTAVGTGTLSYATGLTNVELPDLTSFQFTETLSGPLTLSAQPIVAVFDLVDLSAFDLTLSGTTASSLYISTTNQAPGYLQSYFFPGIQFLVNTDAGAIGFMTFTDASLSSPEPAAMGLIGLGLVGCWMARRKRRHA